MKLSGDNYNPFLHEWGIIGRGLGGDTIKLFPVQFFYGSKVERSVSSPRIDEDGDGEASPSYPLSMERVEIGGRQNPRVSI